MATGKQVEQLEQDISAGKPARNRAAVETHLSNLGTALGNLKGIKSTLDTVAADASAAGQSDYGLEQIQGDWGSNLASVVSADFSYAGKTGISAFAQLIADLSEQAGLEGTANEMRLYKDGSKVSVTQDA